MKQKCVKYLEQWLFVGDNSRYVFLKWLLENVSLQPISTLSKHNIVLKYGFKSEVHADKDKLFFQCSKTLPCTCINFPAENFEMEEIDVKNIIFFEEAPFCRESTYKKIEELRRKYQGSHICIAIMDLPRNQAYSDLLKAGEDVQQAKRKYSDLGYSIITVTSANDIAKVFGWKEASLWYWQQQLVRDMDAFAECIKDLEADFEFILEDLRFDDGILSIKFKDALTSYSLFAMAVHLKKPIWQYFSMLAEEKLFPATKKGGVYEFIDIYLEKMDDSKLCFCDKDTEINLAADKLRSCYRKKFKNSRFTKVSIGRCLTEAEYNKAVNDKGNELYGMRAEFTVLFNSFVENDITDILSTRLMQNYKRMRGLLNER